MRIISLITFFMGLIIMVLTPNIEDPLFTYTNGMLLMTLGSIWMLETKITEVLKK